MKNLLFLFIFLIGFSAQAQQDNPFAESDRNTESVLNSGPNKGPELANADPGNPDGDGDPLPVPIDGYIPALLIAALGLITYTTYRRKTVS